MRDVRNNFQCFILYLVCIEDNIKPALKFYFKQISHRIIISGYEFPYIVPQWFLPSEAEKKRQHIPFSD